MVSKRYKRMHLNQRRSIVGSVLFDSSFQDELWKEKSSIYVSSPYACRQTRELADRRWQKEL